MILIHKISELDLKYKEDINECLIHNAADPIISKIVIFSDVKDVDKKIKIDQNSKKVLLMKIAASHFEILKYAKKAAKSHVIYSTPFMKFKDLGSLKSLGENDIIKDDYSYYIFRKNLKIVDGRTIDSILQGNILKANVSVQKLGYYRVSGFPPESVGWQINRGYVEKKSIVRKEESVIVPLANVEMPVVKKTIDVKLEKENELIESPIKYGSTSVIKPKNRRRKLDVVIVSVNYNDFLILSLENNVKIFDHITVVTSSHDFMCKRICDKFGVNCIMTDVMYEDGAVFNKGKAINKGISSISDPDFILLLDADIIVANKIDLKYLEGGVLYTSDRYVIPDYEHYKKYAKLEIDRNGFLNDPDRGLGFFQLFDFSEGIEYPESSDDASLSDLLFRDRFQRRESIYNEVLHLGMDSNWRGRRSKIFLNDLEFNLLLEKADIFDFEINEYFDKIYCINLSRRDDRWRMVKNEFDSKGISVDRFFGVDGKELDDIEIDIDPRRASILGILENKAALGCLLSHINLIKDAKKNGYQRILVFEDDVVLSNDFKDRISEISAIDWKLVYLGASQFDWDNIRMANGFYKARNTLGSFAYCLDLSIYDELIELLSSKINSVDNYFSRFQIERNDCYVFYPNIAISMVNDSEIREQKNIFEYSKKVRWDLSKFDQFKRILLVPDVRDWAFDNIAKAIIRYNPYPDRIFYDVSYIVEMENNMHEYDLDEYDYVYVFFEAERLIPDSPKIIRGCYSAFWLEEKHITPKLLGSFFSNCRATIFANDYLKDSILPYLPDRYPTRVIHDSADEKLFYPKRNSKNKSFTVIFVGNTKRPVKRFDEIVNICDEAGVDLMVCSDIKNDDLVNYYNKADVCINFSDFEGGPQTFIESSLCEVPMLIRSNNELSKLIPCFTGDTKKDFVDILIRLKKNRKECRSLGKKARIAALEGFTYSNTAKKFANFFLDIDSDAKRDLSETLTVFIIRSGQNPNYIDCLNSLKKQTVNFLLKEIVDIAPMSKAFQKMIDDCETEYYIQVDEDMILDENSIEKIYDEVISSDDKVAIVAHMLRDVHLDFDIYGIKGYKHSILKNYPYNLKIISCEVDQMNRMNVDGYSTSMIEKVVGRHSPKWSPELIYERYFDLMEKWKKFKYHWMGEIPAKLLKIFQDSPSNINLYALMGALSSIYTEEPIRNREKNFRLKDDNFERIKEMLQKKYFFHIK